MSGQLTTHGNNLEMLADLKWMLDFNSNPYRKGAAQAKPEDRAAFASEVQAFFDDLYARTVNLYTRHGFNACSWRNLQDKPRKRHGHVYKSVDREELHADIQKGFEISIFGVYKNHINGPQRFAKNFRIGDECKYGSYNLIYTGTIVAIGEKTITVKDHGKNHQLSIYDFTRQNWNFDAERIAAHNAEEMYCI